MNGKVVDLRQRTCDILDIPLAYINSSRYICDRCYRDIKRLEKIREDSTSLHVSLKDRFVSTNRVKRGVPSDACISPIATAPPKAHRPCTKPDSRVSKSLQFGKEPLILPRPIDGPPVPQVSVVLPFAEKPLVENVIAEGDCEGNVCKVQVS